MNNRNNKRRNNRGTRKSIKPKEEGQIQSASGSKGISGIRSVSTNVTKDKTSRASVSTNTGVNSNTGSTSRQKEQKSSKDRRNRRDRRDFRESRDPRDNRENRDNRDNREPRENRDSRESKEAREARERANQKKNILKKLNILNNSGTKPAVKRRGGAGRIRGLQRKKIVLYKVSASKSTNCPICDKLIKNMNNALVDEQSGQAAHFDCIFESIKKRFNPGKGQRVVYVGTGGFALIEDVRENGRDKFKIVEKVQYNNKKTVK